MRSLASSNTGGERLWPVLRILCWLSLLATLSIFVWLSPRGFEFTDESFYLLSLSWWRDITTSVSLVGLVLGPIFQLISEDIALFRVIGIFLLLGSGAWMAMAALHFIGSVERRESKLDGLIPVVVMAAATLYYSTFNVLRVPSYNLLAVCTLMLSTGSLFRLLTARSRAHQFMLRAVEYGVFVSLCAAGKISTGVMLGIFHLCAFAVLVEKPRMKALLSAVLCAILGCCLVAAALLLARHDAIEVLLNGLSFWSAQDPRSPLLNSLRWDLQRQVARHWQGLLMVLVVRQACASCEIRHRDRCIAPG